MPTGGHGCVLNQLEGLTRVLYCRHCFGVGQRCQCSAVPHQAPGLTAPLWMPPTVSYVTMASSTETTASTSATGVTPPSHLPPRAPAIEPMDTLLPLTMENLLATAGVGQGHKPDPAVNASCPWSPTDETSDASTAGTYSRRAGYDASNTLLTTGVPT